MLYHKEKIEELIMFYEYQTEIMGLIAILVLLNVYLLIRIQKEKTIKKENNKVQQKNTQITKTLEGAPDNEDILGALDSYDNYNSLENDNKMEEKESFEKLTSLPSFCKRHVPPHHKITKEDFQEFAGIRILVAEDNLINQKVISGLLADSGIEVVLADDGKILLEILETDTNFTLILMDAHMPRIDGFEATRQIRANPNYNHIVVIALSGDTAADDIKKMQEAGMSEHLEKPLKMGDLYDIFYAYTTEKNKTNNSSGTIVQMQELDEVKGLEICGGDKEFYNEILHEFAQTYQNSAAQLFEYVHHGKFQDADRVLLDIVGITANIGANSLHRIALEMKHELQNTQNTNHRNIVKKYEVHLQTLLHDIQNYLKS